MDRKPFTLRQAVIAGAALTAGSAVGTLIETISAHYTYSQPGIGQLATAATTLWIIDKLNKLIDDTR
jgi:hypothetical protein